MILRNWWTASFGILASFVIGLFWLAGIMHSLRSESGVYWWEWVFYSTFHPIVCWLLLKASFFTRIELKDGVIIVNNLFVKHVVPARRVSSVSWRGGVDIVLEDGSKWWCFNLGGSLLGAIAGYPTNRRCARRIELHVQRNLLDGKDVGGQGVVTSPYLNLVFLFGASLASFALVYILSLIDAY